MRATTSITSALVLMLAACSRAPAPAPPPPPAAAPAVAGEEHIQAGDVRIDHGNNVALPAGFPADVPLPSAAHLTDAVQLGGVNIVGFALPSAPADTAAAMLSLYQGQGWHNYSRVGGQPVMGTDGFDKEGRKLVYTIVPDGSGSKVSLRVYPKGGP